MAQDVKSMKIRITRACIVKGEHAGEGQLFEAPKDIPLIDAKYLVGIQKAEVVDESKPVEKKSVK